MSKRFTLFCGIDCGKRQHALTVLDRDGQVVLAPQYFSNDRAGFEKALNLLKEHGSGRVMQIGLEATGHYWYALHEYLHGHGYELAVLNPLQTSEQRRRSIRKRKTDKIDSGRVARLLRSGEARAALIPDDLAMTCRQVTRLWYALGSQRTRVKQLLGAKLDCIWPEFQTLLSSPLCVTGRAVLKAAPAPADLLALDDVTLVQLIERASRGRLGAKLAADLRQSASGSIGMKRGIEGMRLAIGTLLRQLEATEPVREELRERIEELSTRLPPYLLSLPGVSAVSATSLFGETDPISTFACPDQLVAFSGLDPTVFQTGEYLAPHRVISKRGCPYLRHTLWMMASHAVLRDGDLRRYYLRRRKAGLHHLSAVTATALRLCHVVWRILTDRRPYRPEGRPAGGQRHHHAQSSH